MDLNRWYGQRRILNLKVIIVRRNIAFLKMLQQLTCLDMRSPMCVAKTNCWGGRSIRAALNLDEFACGVVCLLSHANITKQNLSGSSRTRLQRLSNVSSKLFWKRLSRKIKCCHIFRLITIILSVEILIIHVGLTWES